MPNVIIKNVPAGCEEKVKQLAMIAIERFLKPEIDVDIIDSFEDDVDDIYVANDLPKKFKKND